MKIVLINPPWADTYGEFKDSAKSTVSYPPLGLCYLSSLMKACGHIVKIVDFEAEDEERNEIIDSIISCAPEVIGITAATTVFHHAKEIAEEIKKRLSIPIVIGGPHVTLVREKAMRDGGYFDYGIYGEGEETFRELITVLESSGSVDTIKGIMYRKNGEIIVNEPRPYLDDLDALPFPDFESLQLNKYCCHIPQKGVVPFLPVATSRGCPFLCIYCSAPSIFGKKVRFRSVNNVLDEFEYIVKDLKIFHLAFVDETLCLNRRRLVDLCRGIIERGLELTMEGWTRPNTVDEEVLGLMKKAGFVQLSFGIESGDAEILKIIRCDVKKEDVQKAFTMAKRVGLETKGFVMIGHPYETKQTASNTLKFIRNLKDCDQIYINITTPYPGTKLHEMATKGEGGMHLLTENYSEYRKYGNAVIEVNDLSREDLIGLQKKGFIMFYLTPKRFIYNIKRAGLKSAAINSFAFLKSVMGKSK